jgi:hypothetical protein
MRAQLNHPQNVCVKQKHHTSGGYMKIRIAVLLLVMLVAVPVLAQPPRMTPQERADQMAKQLALTADQKAKVLELFTQEEKTMPKPDMQGDREAFRAAMEKRREQRDIKLKGILTEKQFAEYEKQRAQWRQRGGPGGPGREPAGKPVEKGEVKEK